MVESDDFVPSPPFILRKILIRGKLGANHNRQDLDKKALDLCMGISGYGRPSALFFVGGERPLALSSLPATDPGGRNVRAVAGA